MENEPKKTFISYRNKVVGFIKGKTFYSRRTTDHWFRMYQGWGCSIEILAELQNREIEDFVIIFQGRMFRTEITSFFILGKRYDDELDKQLILPHKYFKEVGIIEETQQSL